MTATLIQSDLADADALNASELPTLRVGGTVSQKQMKKLARRVRSGRVGPTSVYYAGVTAPAIAAGMSTIVSASLERAGVDPYWTLLSASLVAAMAGITWYLIFMRWSYRHSYGRTSEVGKHTDVEVDEAGIFWTRGHIRTRISWDGISDITADRNFIRVHVMDGDDVLIPANWFEQRKDRKTAIAVLQEYRDRASGDATDMAA
ncbi:YcxB family protein [Ponticaulis sp.]|uniref:YcxB family protein n=1 Tax=Ponticaulis sp. TaxID=2020902 RepID=UPI00262A2D08|nr:YcxB family protein [Ponticaulis sp.]MDF1679764.1 YcxB family protein [Ponticaulis sp.]